MQVSQTKLVGPKDPHALPHFRPGVPVPESQPWDPLTLKDAVRLLGTPTPAGGASSASLRRGLENIALVYVSGRSTFDSVLREAVLQYAPLGHVFKTDGMVPGNYVKGLENAFATFPNASWYYLADDDSFVDLERLAQFTASLDASAFHFIGHRDCKGTSCGMAVKCRRQAMGAGLANPGWACGGPGVLVSRPLAEAMVQKRCADFYGRELYPVCCGDIALACCASDAWEGFEVSHTLAFVPKNASAGATSSPAAVAVHKLEAETTRKLGKMYNSHLAA